MADQFDRESVEQRNEALERQNQLLERQVDALSRSADLSNTLLDTLKEELGIQNRRSTSEEHLLDINKKINKEISNQKFGLSNVATIQKQIDKNEILRTTALTVINSLERKINSSTDENIQLQKEIADQFSQQLVRQKEIQTEIDEINDEIEAGNGSRAHRLGILEDELLALDESNDILYNSLETDGKRLAMSKAQVLTLDTVIERRKKEQDTLEEIEKTLGVTGKLLNVISRVPGLGKFAQDAYAAVQQQQKSLAEANKTLMTQHETIKMFGEEIGKGIKESIEDPLTLGIGLFNELGKSASAVDSRVTGLQKQLGLGRIASAGLSFDFRLLTYTTNDAFITTQKLTESFAEFSNQLGFAVDFSGQTLETFTTLNKRLGLSVEQASTLTSLLKLQGNDTEDQLGNLVKQIGSFNTLNGTAFNTKQVLGDISSTSAAIQVSFAGSTKKLAGAVLEAKKLGTNLSSVDKIAESLLNFETSIENELKAELLIGREINLERARLLALNNDLEGVAEELQNQNIGFFEFSKMNRIQQQAISEAMGMGREEMSEMLLQQQRMTMTNEEISSQLEGQELSNFKQLTFQESLNSALEKMRDIFTTIAEGPIGIIAGAMADILSNSYVLHGVLGLITASLGKAAIHSGVTLAKSIGTAIAAIFRGNAKFGPVGLAMSGAAVGVLLAAITQATTKAKQVGDLGINPNGGPIVYSPQEGSLFQGTKGDGLSMGPTMGTNPITNVNSSEQKRTNPITNVNSSEQKRTNILLEKLLAKNSDVYMDTSKVGYAESLSFSKL